MYLTSETMSCKINRTNVVFYFLHTQKREEILTKNIIYLLWNVTVSRRINTLFYEWILRLTSAPNHYRNKSSLLHHRNIGHFQTAISWKVTFQYNYFNSALVYFIEENINMKNEIMSEH